MYKKWMVRFIRTKRIESMQRMLWDLIILSGSDYLTAELQHRITAFNDPTVYEGNPSSPYA